MQITGMEAVRLTVEVETKRKKMSILAWALVHLGFAVALSICHLMWRHNVNLIQGSYEELCREHDIPIRGELYDIMWVMGRMSDQAQADEYRRELEKSCDKECRELGNRWSIIYEFCGFTLMLLAVNGIAQAIGAYSFHARAIAACCGCLLGCVNFAAIITTCVFRFNIMGRYSTLSLMPSQYD